MFFKNFFIRSVLTRRW